MLKFVKKFSVIYYDMNNKLVWAFVDRMKSFRDKKVLKRVKNLAFARNAPLKETRKMTGYSAVQSLCLKFLMFKSTPKVRET